MLFFGYTQCPDVCPTTLASMRDVLARLGDDAKRVQVVFVTLDPVRDTPEVLAEYVKAFHPSFIGLHGDEATTAAVARDFKVFYAKQAGSTAGSYSIDPVSYTHLDVYKRQLSGHLESRTRAAIGLHAKVLGRVHTGLPCCCSKTRSQRP